MAPWHILSLFKSVIFVLWRRWRRRRKRVEAGLVRLCLDAGIASTPARPPQLQPAEHNGFKSHSVLEPLPRL